MSDTVHHRAHGVVWRLAPDRVLVRRVGDLSEHGVADLVGLAAAAWVALDEPATGRELTARLADAAIDDAGLDDALRQLTLGGWIERDADQPADQVR